MKEPEPENIDLISPLSPEECYLRLKNALSTSNIFHYDSKPLGGKVSKTSIKLMKRDRRNNFRPILYASLKPASEGTAILGTIKTPLHVEIFMYFWFAGVLLIGGMMVYFSFLSFLEKGFVPKTKDWIPFAAFPLMLILGRLFVKHAKYSARDEPEYLRNVVTKLLEAKEP